MSTASFPVSIAPRYQKAVRLDHDLGTLEALEGYVSSATITELIGSMATQIEKAGQAAFTWTGPYGGGKSSLAVVFSGLFDQRADVRAASERVIGMEAASRIREVLPTSSGGWEVAAVVGSKTDPILEIARSLEMEDESPNEIGLIEHIKSRISAGPGLVLLIDEMGKFLEAASAGDADVHVFQQLAELANRNSKKFIFVGVLHQAFSDYAGRVARSKRDEWSKIQGRFLDLSVNLAEEEQLEVISRAIVSDHPAPKSYQALAKKVGKFSQEGRKHPNIHIAQTLGGCWPLHPITAMLLGPVSRRRFGQNQRSIFGFLNSHEPSGFRSFLSEAKRGELFMPANLWDYLQLNLEPSILASPDSHRWATTSEAIVRAEQLGGSPIHIETLKTIALIELFGERAGLRASKPLLETCVAEGLDDTVEDLKKWSLVVFRRFKDALAIFAGSDFDIDTAVEQAYRELPPLKLSELNELASLHPELAKRFYHQTGSMRWFANILLSVEDLNEPSAPQLPKGAIGAFGLVAALDPAGEQEIQDKIGLAANRWKSSRVLLGASKRASTAVMFAKEIQALEYIQTNNVEHAGDPVARKEVASRIAELRARAKVELEMAFESAEWHAEKKKPFKLIGLERSRFTSRRASEIFPKLPPLQNELLNRDKPSSNATAAQNALLKAMILREAEPRLGIEGYPAEGGLYAALLETTGLHRKVDGQWRVTSPCKKTAPELADLWELTTAFLQSNSDRTVGLDEVYDLWRAEPVGMKRGLMAVLSMAFVLSMRDKIAFYREGVFQPSLKDIDADVLSRDAADVQVRWMELSVDAKDMLSSLASTVRELDESYQLLDLAPIDVARGLIAIFSSLPAWTTKTLKLSKNALKVRNLFKKAHDPNKLLFDDLPRELGSATNSEGFEELSESVSSALRELVEAYPGALRRLETLLLSELNVPGSSAGALSDLRERAKNIERVSGNHQTDAFVLRLGSYEGRLSDIEGLITLVLSKNLASLSDIDLDKAALELAEHAQKFNRLEAFARVKGRKDRRHAVSIVLGIDQRPTPYSDTFEVTAEDRPQVDQLVSRINSAINEAGKFSDEVVLAALAKRLSETIASKNSQEVRGTDDS